MIRTARIATAALAVALCASANAQANSRLTTIVIDYVGESDKPVFPIVISSSVDEAGWYKQKLFRDPFSSLAQVYIVSESTLKTIADIPLPSSGSKHQKAADGPKTSPALWLAIANGHDFHEVTLDAGESMSLLSEIKKRVSESPPLVDQLSDIDLRIHRYLRQAH